MDRAWTLIVFAVLAWGAASTAEAQPPHDERPGPERRPMPPATVVARVNVNVETEVDVSNEAPAGGASEEEEEEDEEEQDAGNGLAEIIESVLGRPGAGSGVQVIADVNVSVETSIKVRGQWAKAAGPKASGAAAEKAQKDNGPEKSANPASDGTPPRKKRARKRDRKSQETSETPKREETGRSVSLDRLKIGENLELGVTGALDSEQRASQLAQRINVGKNQTLLGMALVGMMLPEEAESLKVVQKAVSSVQANASGNELSVSVAIPKETPGAVKTLVEAALEKR